MLRSALVAAALALPARAAAEEIILARVTATDHGENRALDADRMSAWCPAGAGTLTVIFPKPVTIRSLVLYAGRMDARAYDPPVVHVALGDEEHFVDTTDNGRNPFEVDRAAGRVVTRVAVRIEARHDNCLSELELHLAEGPWVYGLPPRAVAALPGAIASLTVALQRCDRRGLARQARYPLFARELALGNGAPTNYYMDQPAERIAGARELAERCHLLVFRPDDEDHLAPSLVGSIARDTVRVIGAAYVGRQYWHLAWTGRAWRLAGLAYYAFE